MGQQNIQTIGQPDAWISVDQAGNQVGRNAVLSGVGPFTLTLGSPIGEAATGNNCQVEVDFNAAVPLVCQVTHTSATVKTLAFFVGTTGAATGAVTRMGITVRKLQ